MKTTRTTLPRTMRAAVMTGPESVELREVPLPVPKPDEVLIHIEGCGLCGSNLPVWQGRPWFEYPAAPGSPGHEGWGTVVGLGAEVQGIEIGERVAALSYHALAEYDVAHQDALVRLPERLRNMDFPGEPLGCAMNILRRSEIREGDTVAVVGIGFIGAALTQLARAAGARVFAISRRSFSLDLARELGAEATFALDEDGNDDRTMAGIEDLTSGRGCDRVIEAVGLQRPLDLASRLTRVRGRLIIAGYHQDGPRLVNIQDWNWRGLDVINAHERDPRVYVEGIRSAVDAVESGTIELSRLVSHRIELGRVAEAFQLLDSRPDGFLKAEVLI